MTPLPPRCWIWWALAESFGSLDGADSMLPSPTPASITDALAGLEDLDELPTADHVARFSAVHNSLTAALSGIDEV